MASRQVCSPEWERSTITRFAFSRATTSRPNGVSPRFSGAMEPSPSWLAGL